MLYFENIIGISELIHFIFYDTQKLLALIVSLVPLSKWHTIFSALIIVSLTK
jgi:hypothetical protein